MRQMLTRLSSVRMWMCICVRTNEFMDVIMKKGQKEQEKEREGKKSHSHCILIVDIWWNCLLNCSFTQYQILPKLQRTFHKLLAVVRVPKPSGDSEPVHYRVQAGVCVGLLPRPEPWRAHRPGSHHHPIVLQLSASPLYLRLRRDD